MKNMSTLLSECRLCPHNCGIDRSNNKVGVCKSGFLPKVALAGLHYWEEPCISGEKGSGTVFFSHCNLKCVFCQNYKISQEHYGVEVSIERLAQIILNLQNEGAHNINLVSATQYIPQLKEALLLSKSQGLNIPVVYNTNAYENEESLKNLEGLIDVFLPDLKYFDDSYALKYSSAPNYFRIASRAVLEMYRQVGTPIFDDYGIIKRGVIIRHLMIPGLLEDSKKILKWIRDNLPYEIYISLMAQYTPTYNAENYAELKRRIKESEYDELIDYFFEIGLENGFVQELSSATCDYTPEFDLRGI